MRLLEISHLVLQQKCRRLSASSLQGYIFVHSYDQCGVVINLKTNVGQIRRIRRCRNVTSLQTAFVGSFQPSHVAGEAPPISCDGGIASLMDWGVG